MGRKRGFDAIIVGARCAGAPLAMLLARAGHRVLLADRSAFPSDTLSTHYIHQLGIAKLDEWGLLDEIRRTSCPPIRRLTIESGPKALQTFFMEFGTRVDAYCVRRTVLDKVLVDAAVAAGAELRERLVVSELVRAGERVVGIRARRGDRMVEETARVVIGADGANSTIAKLVRARRYWVAPMQTCCLYSYWRDLDTDRGEIHFHDGAAATVFPTNDGLCCVSLAWPTARIDEVRNHPQQAYEEGLNRFVGLRRRLARAEQVESLRAWWGRVDNHFRRPGGPGWALVGDAGYHRDPLTALGITDAFRDAGLLARALDDGLSGRSPLAAALARYEKERNDVARPLYNFTLEVARASAWRPRTPASRKRRAAAPKIPAAASLYLNDAVR